MGSSLEVPLCSPESVSVCLRRSPLLPLLLSRLRLWHPLNVNTLCGSEDLFWLLFLHSKVCGSARKNMTNLDHPLSIASASKKSHDSTNLVFRWYFLRINAAMRWVLSMDILVSNLVLFF